MFEPDAEDGLRACLIDFQLVAAGDPQLDVAYFIAGSLDVESRRTQERDLVARHCATVGTSDYDFDEAFRAYRLNCLYILLNSVTSLTMIADTAHNREMVLQLLERSTAAVLDNQSLDLLRDRVAIAIT